MWVPHPSEIIMLRASGVGDMGDVTNIGSVARFALDDVDSYVLAWVRALFVGGTGSATMTLKLDHCDPTGHYDFALRDWPTMGTSGIAWVFSRVPADELFHWKINKGGILVFEWTNPDAGNMRWSLEIGLADAGQLTQ